MAVCAYSLSCNGSWSVLLVLAFAWRVIPSCAASQISIGARLLASDQSRVWVSDNGTFAFGFSPAGSGGVGGDRGRGASSDRFLLAIWFAELPGDRTVVWSANRLAFLQEKKKNICEI